jgi:hypothetical protein
MANTAEFNSRLKSIGQKLLNDEYNFLNSSVKTDNLDFFVCLKINSTLSLENYFLTLKDLRLLLVAQFVSSCIGQK